MSDPIEVVGKVSDAVTAGAELSKPAVDLACNLIGTLLGKPIEAASGVLFEKIESYRFMRCVKIADMVDRVCKQRKIDPRKVAPSFVLPYFGAAGNTEDDPTIDALWAQLMASAIENDANAHPMHIESLKRMSVLDARQFSDVAHKPMGHRSASLRAITYGNDERWRLLATERLISIALMEGAPTTIPISPSANQIVLRTSIERARISRYGEQLARAVMPDLPLAESISESAGVATAGTTIESGLTFQ